jgi:hypothetical protein
MVPQAYLEDHSVLSRLTNYRFKAVITKRYAIPIIPNQFHPPPPT